LDPANSLLLLDAADDVGSMDVRAVALQCVVNHFTEIMEDSQSPDRLEALPKRVLVEVLSALAAHSSFSSSLRIATTRASVTSSRGGGGGSSNSKV
jgi:hypothetical protein